LVIAHSPFRQSHRAVALTQVAALHHDAIEHIRQPGHLAALQLQHRHQLHAGRFQTRGIAREAIALSHSGIAQLLQPLAGRGLASAQPFLDLALGRRTALDLDGRLHTAQVMFALDGAHQHFLASIVMAVRTHAAIEADAVHQQVHMLMLCVEVARDHVLVVVQSHAVQVARGHLPPLAVAQMLARRG
jgi:hypothetical protein